MNEPVFYIFVYNEREKERLLVFYKDMVIDAKRKILNFMSGFFGAVGLVASAHIQGKKATERTRKTSGDLLSIKGSVSYPYGKMYNLDLLRKNGFISKKKYVRIVLHDGNNLVYRFANYSDHNKIKHDKIRLKDVYHTLYPWLGEKLRIREIK